MWKSVNSFEGTFGNYDGEELCRVIGKYNQSLKERIFLKEQMGLYRDN